VKDFTVMVPKPKFNIWPAYELSLRRSTKTMFPPMQFVSGEHKFKILDCKEKLPCARSTYIIRNEYEHVRKLLIKAEDTKWEEVSKIWDEPMQGANLDYKVSGQPGGGM